MWLPNHSHWNTIVFLNLHIDEHTGPETLENHFVKKNGNFPNILLIKFTLKVPFYAYHWVCITLYLTNFINILMLVCILRNINLTNTVLFLFCKMAVNWLSCFSFIQNKYHTNQNQNMVAILPILKLSIFQTLMFLWIQKVQKTQLLKGIIRPTFLLITSATVL